jgi:predicted permease
MLWKDAKYALRQLLKTPGFTLTAVLTLALGIGVNAAMFSVIDQTLLRPLPYKNANRIVEIGTLSQSAGFTPMSLPDIHDFQARSHAFQSIAFTTIQFQPLRGSGAAQITPQVLSSTNLFDIVGVKPALGRGFVPDDAKAGQNNVMVLSDAVWKKNFGADASVIGRSVSINGDPFLVIGVLPPNTDFPVNIGAAIYTPLNVDDKDLAGRDDAGIQPFGLLRPGVSLQQARNELNSIRKQLLVEYPKEESKDLIRVEKYRDALTESQRPALFALNAAVIAVWLIACANVAGLMLTRTNSRRREIAIRGALGANRNRLIQQFLTESLLIALAGGAVGLAFASGILRVLKKYLENTLFYGDQIHINGAVCFFLLAASCASALFFGIVPASMAASVPAQEGLREGAAATGTSKRQARWRDALVVGEITLTLALLIAAGLMMRTLLVLRHADLGFTADNVVTGSLFLPTHGTWFTASDPAKSPSLVNVLYGPLLEKLRHTPGITEAGLTTVRPLMPNWNFIDGIVVNGRPKQAKSDEVNANVRASTTGYFKTFGIRLIKGRFFNSEDTPDTPIAIVVNTEFVKRVFPNEDPIGKQIQMNDNGPREWGTIVGVAEDVRQRSAGEASQPEIDVNLMQVTQKDEFYSILASFLMNISVRTHLPPPTAETAIRDAVHELAPDVAVQNVQSMQQAVDDSMGDQTLAARLLGVFGLAALAIAVAGIYGLLSYSVSQRTREFGVRIALGSPQSKVLWLVLRHALILLAIGVAGGIAIAFAASSVMRAFIYGFHGYDIFTVFAVAAILALCGLAASYIPARRAAAVNPIEALRTE